MTAGRWTMRAAGALLLLGYPALLFFGVTHWSARTLGFVMAGALTLMAAARLRSVPREQIVAATAPFLPTTALVLVAALLDDRRSILALPVAINLALLVPFANSLRAGRVPMIQRFAEIERMERRPGSRLSPSAIAHCRRVTRVWCAFFVFNGAMAASLAYLAPIEWWVGYTCFVSYLLMGAIFAGERIARRAVAREPMGLALTDSNSDT